MNHWTDVMVANYPTPTLQLVEGRGALVKGNDGKQYLDLIGGIAVQTLGHSHPAVVEAATKQMETLQHTSNLYAHEPGLTLATMLQARTYGYHVLFVNSGTEANEAALKVVRARCQDNPESVVLAFGGSFHGRTAGSLALTGQAKHKHGFGPLPDQIVHVPFNDVDALEEMLRAHDVGAIFFEPIQGEGGVIPMTEAMATALQNAQTQGTLLVADEVQTGIGRTGSFWAHQVHGLQPDIITSAKALGAGLPLGACLMRPELAEGFGPGSHGCTFGGNPVAAAASIAMLQELETQRLVPRVAKLGTRIQETLASEGVSFRGAGLLWAIDHDDPGEAQSVLENKGILVGSAGKALRISPAFTVNETELLEAVSTICEVIKTP
ncbi:MAG: aspartate aminotransferase family protein [Thermoplasmatota archaeon]